MAIASGPAFSFVYQDNLEALAAAGAELLPFDPRLDPGLPDGSTALYVGGGFPEVFVAGLSENRPLQRDLRAKASDGLVMWAECGGLLWLARSLDGHPLAGIVPAEGIMTDRLTLGYRTAELRVDSPLGPGRRHAARARVPLLHAVAEWIRPHAAESSRRVVGGVRVTAPVRLLPPSSSRQ